MTPEEGYIDSALLTSQRFGIKRRIWFEVKNQIYINILQNQGDQIRTSNVH
jgi:hypothetical protein